MEEIIESRAAEGLTDPVRRRRHPGEIWFLVLATMTVFGSIPRNGQLTGAPAADQIQAIVIELGLSFLFAFLILWTLKLAWRVFGKTLDLLGVRCNRVFAAVVLAVAWLFASFVWPTAYRYDHIGEFTTRMHRISGEAEVLFPGRGWISMKEAPL